MNKILIVLLTLLFNIQQANAFSIDAFMDKNVAPVSDAIAAIIFHPIHVLGADVPIQRPATCPKFFVAILSYLFYRE